MIEKFIAMSLDELPTLIDETDDVIDRLEEAFDVNQGQGVEEEYGSMKEKRDTEKKITTDAVDYGNIKAVLTMKAMQMQGGSDEVYNLLCWRMSMMKKACQG